ncbi:hypothetical protein [Variovorax guangxiensis]|uniref:Uncharacterized protein n=1 Tax=Variovorax guangxiensis TaxID=1775474 RepID=A0A502DH90_9BURK|nr:hypothetical protein [Variovorax guangxiensis]TPG23461.1 hypothetical protein EAH82_20570 [Variovorax guangxiensis]TPG24080.1 hypothetical protein EAH83_06150 [Variovorax ginsengisoli]
MNIVRTFKVACLTFLVATLAACGDPKISAVKGTRLRGDEFTVGETLGKVKECKSADWSSELVNNVTIVTHTCTIAIDDSVFRMSKEKALRDLRDAERVSVQSYNEAVTRATAQLEGYKRQDGAYTADLTGKLEQIDRDIAALDQPFVFVRRFLGQTEEMTKKADEESRARRRVEYAELKERLLREIDSSKSSDHRNIEESKRILENYTSWDDKYAAAVTQTREALKKEIDARYDKDHVVQVKTSFKYREGALAELVYAGIVIDGQKRGSTIPVYLMDPKRMGEFIAYMTKDGFGMDVFGRYDESFPIQADYGDSTSYAQGYKYKGQVAAN